MTNMVGLGDDTWPLCYLLGDFSLEISRIKVNHQIRSTLKSPFLGGFKQSLPHWFGSWWFGNSKGHLHIYTPHIYRNRFHRQSLGCLWLLSCESPARHRQTFDEVSWMIWPSICRGFARHSMAVVAAWCAASSVPMTSDPPLSWLGRWFSFSISKELLLFSQHHEKSQSFLNWPFGCSWPSGGTIEVYQRLVQEPLCWTSRARGDGVAFCEPHPGQ